MIDYGGKSIATALRFLNSPSKLGTHSLARAQFINEIINSAGGMENEENRGTALSHFIEEMIEKKHNLEVDNLDWRILYDRMINEKSLKQISYDLGISQRTVSRYYLRACTRLGKTLLKYEVTKT